MYEDYIRDFRPFEEEILNLTNDTSLIDNAVPQAEAQNRLAAEIQQRNLGRYGGQSLLTPVERAEQQKAMSLGAATNIAGSFNNAQLAQRDLNYNTLASIIGLGQGVRQNALSGLASVNAMKAQRDMAYQNALADSQAGFWNTVGTIGGLGLAAFSI